MNTHKKGDIVFDPVYQLTGKVAKVYMEYDKQICKVRWFGLPKGRLYHVASDRIFRVTPCEHCGEFIGEHAYECNFCGWEQGFSGGGSETLPKKEVVE